MIKVKFIKHPAGWNYAYNVGDEAAFPEVKAKQLLDAGIVSILETLQIEKAESKAKPEKRNRK
jgi:hypothetical protein